jgi:hypothetical protein
MKPFEAAALDFARAAKAILERAPQGLTMIERRNLNAAIEAMAAAVADPARRPGKVAA